MSASLRFRFVCCLAGCSLLALALPAGALARSKSTTLFQNVPQTLTAKCHGDQRATGGGFRTAPLAGFPSFNVNVDILESRKVGQGAWRVSAIERGTDPAPFTAIVYCRGEASKTKQVTSGPTFGVAEAQCRGGDTLQSGGFARTNNGFSFGLFANFRAPRQTWRVADFSGSGLRSFADCADADSLQARTGTAATSTSGAAITARSKKCPGGKPSAGGYLEPDGPSAGFYGIYESVRSGKRWLTSGVFFNFGGPPPSTPPRLESIAYCS